MVWAVGLTGGIGSGKSTVAHIFSTLGVPVYDADRIAHELLAKNTPAFNTICAHFGKDICLASGELNRRRLREIIFANPDERLWLEKQLHPRIDDQLREAIQHCVAPYCIVMIPLLAEHIDRYRKMLSSILVVETTFERQIAWAMQRDNMSEAFALQIIQAQASNQVRRDIADTVISNTATLDELKHRVLAIHRQLLEQAQKS